MGTTPSRMVVAGSLWAALCFGVSPVQAQAAGCTYDECALRTEGSFFSARLVRGRQAEKVAGFGFFPPRIPLFEQAADSVRIPYEAYRASQRTAAWLNLTGGVLSIASLVVFLADDENVGLSTGLTIAGLGFGIGGSIASSRASNHLGRAIWWYNRDLPRSP